MPENYLEIHSRWLAASLAKPVAPISPELTSAGVYQMMAEDETIFALPITVDGTPLGLIDRASMMSYFARQYWRELFARRPITVLMDRTPLTLEAELPIEAVAQQAESMTGPALDAAFIVVRDGRYVGIGSSVDLLKRIAERAQERALALQAAHVEIRAFNETLEQRIEEATTELRVAQEELVRKERLSALGQLTATVAHELRNPLSSIRNTVFAFKESTKTAAPQFERSIARIERSLVRCDRIISDLLDFTRAREPELSTATADDWLGEVLDELQVPSDVEIVRRFSAPQCKVRFDKERMRRVVVNLIENAAQALAESAPSGRGRSIVVATRATTDYELCVEDTGPGIAPDILPKVFEPLFTTKSFGTGLGLATVKQIVEQHAGTVTIESEIGRGTRVTIRLPIALRHGMAA